MQYVIAEASGSQFWLEEAFRYKFDRIQATIGDQLVFKKILLYKKDSEVFFGQPLLSNVNVYGHILSHFKESKVIVYKMRSKKKTRKKQGHRSLKTMVQINKIEQL